MNNFKLLSIGLFVLSSFLVGLAHAQDNGVNIQVQVLQRKATDTINDFVWDGQAPLVSSMPLKAVLGASTVKSDYVGEVSKPSTPIRRFTKKPNKYLLFLPPVYAVYYLITIYL